MNRRLFLYVFLGILLFAVFIFVTNFLISVQLKKKSNLEQTYISRFINAIKINNQNLHLEYLNYEYSIFWGLKINDVVIKHPENQEIICKIENVYFDWSFFDFSYQDIKTISIAFPTCNFEKKDFHNFFNDLQVYLLSNNVELEIYGKLKIENLDFFDRYKIFFKPFPKENKIRTKGLIQKEEMVIAKLYGFWNFNQNSGKNTIHFEFYDFPVIVQNFLREFFIEELKEVFSEKLSFFISGKGSMDITNEGYALHFSTKFKEFKMESDFLQISQPKGDIKFLLVKSWDSKILKKEIYIQSEQIHFFTLKELSGEDYNNQFDIQLKMENAFFKTPWNTRGKLNLKGNITKKNNEFIIFLFGSIDKLILVHNINFPVVYLRYAKINSLRKNQLEFEIKGKFSSLDFLYKGTIDLLYDKAPYVTVRSQFIIPNVDYQDFLESLIQIYQKTKQDMLQEDSLKFVDSSLTYKFQNSEFYSKYLKNIDFISEIGLKLPKQNLPELQGYIKTNPNGLSLLLDGNDTSKQNKIKINYSIDYLTNLPNHTILIFLDLKEPKISLPFFCNHCDSLIKRIFFEYNSYSNGLSFADLYFNNSSTFHLQIENIKLTNDYRRELLEKFLETNWKEELFNLKAVYNSNGASYDSIDIQIQNENIHLKGNGSYNIYAEGKLTFYFIDKKNQLYRNFNIKIRRDGSWVPLYFF